MVDVLKQFGIGAVEGVYSYGSVTSVGATGVITVRTTTGLDLMMRDTAGPYAVGDQVVLGKKDKNLSSVFIIKKIDRVTRSAINVAISYDEG